jgi:DNA-binding Lrp family transcriptional regulator
LKGAELRLVSELMKDSRRSDRELARAIRVSQPTVSRMIRKLKRQRVIREYMMIPDFAKLGYEIMALTLISINPAPGRQETDETAAQELMKEEPDSIIMFERGLGLKQTEAIISFHKSYSDYSRFIQKLKQAPTTAHVRKNVESFLINLKDKVHYRPLTLQVLADHILRMNEQKE